ncbi:MAG TPA: peptidylprolyl isomerase [Rudaea sp.]
MRLFVVSMLLFSLASAAFSTYAANEAPLPADRVIVSRGGVDLTLGDVDAYMQTVPEKDRANLLSDGKRAESLVLNLLRNKQLAQQARDLHLDRREAVRYQLAQAQTDVLARARIDEFTATLKLPDFNQLAKETYMSHPKQYTTPARVDVQHVLIGLDKHSDTEARAIAEDVHKQAVANPGEFSDLVTKYSDDPSKDRNQGNIENAASDRVVPEFAQAAKALRTKGEISPIVKTKYGYHILKLVALQPGKQQTFAEVQPQLVESLRAQYIDKQRVQLLDSLAAQKNTTDTEVFTSLSTRYVQPPATTALNSASGPESSAAH